MDKFIKAELKIDTEQLITQYQKILNSNLIEHFGSPKEIDNHYNIYSNSVFSTMFSINRESFDKLVEENMLYIKLNCYEKYQQKILELVEGFYFQDLRLNNYKDKKMVLDYIIDKLYNQLKLTISHYKKQEILIAFYTLASYISEISQKIYSIYDYKDMCVEQYQLKKNEDKILYTVKQYFSDLGPQISSIIASDKRISELLINIILFSEVEFGFRNLDAINFKEIYIIAFSLIHILSLKNAVLTNLSEENWIEFNKFGLIISDNLTYMMNEIAQNSYLIGDQKLNVYDIKLNEIYLHVSKKIKFSPSDLERYLTSQNKFIRDQNLMIIVDRFTIEDDIKYTTGLTDVGVNNLIDQFTLKEIKECEVLNSVFSDEGRVFRNPIINLDGMLLISFPLLIETSKSFRYRILKREIVNDKKISELVKPLFDESYLLEIESKIKPKGVIHEKNWDMAKHFKRLEFPKGISKEIDFVFTRKKILYLIQLKDKKMRLNTKGIVNEKRDIVKDLGKYKRTCEFIKTNIEEVRKYFAEDISDIKSYFLFTRYNPTIHMEIDKEGHEIMTVEDFIREIDRIFDNNDKNV